MRLNSRPETGITYTKPGNNNKTDMSAGTNISLRAHNRL